MTIEEVAEGINFREMWINGKEAVEKGIVTKDLKDLHKTPDQFGGFLDGFDSTLKYQPTDY
jgi:hypothetical protein